MPAVDGAGREDGVQISSALCRKIMSFNNLCVRTSYVVGLKSAFMASSTMGSYSSRILVCPSNGADQSLSEDMGIWGLSPHQCIV